MFRSLVSSLITFVAILIFAFTLLFLWNGSEGITFTRVAFEGDKATVHVLEQYRREQAWAAERAREESDRATGGAMTPAAVGSGEGPAVVVWISIPGFRGDYLDNSETPFFDRLATEGGATNKMRPSFPCLTFPAHATMATGTTPDKHGIIADSIRVASGKIVEKPTDASLLLAEPIWKTATRQGIRTLVHDWPMSQNQTGEHVAAHFLDSYDPESTDETRLNRALEQWRTSSSGGGSPAPDSGGDAPASGEGAATDAPTASAGPGENLRLVMLRLDDIGRQGLAHGPRADETFATVAETDKALKSFFDTVENEWRTLAPGDANLVVFITTDHGLAELDKNVNIAHLLGAEMMKNADIVAHDAVANLYFKDLPESEGETKIFTDRFDNELSKRIYFRTLKKEELPSEWAYLSHDRTGDRVLVLKTGYAFSEHRASEPVFDPADGPNLFGGFGYPVEESIRMSGQIFLAGFPNSPLAGSLEEVKQTTFHATVCKMLGIQPAEGAITDTIGLK